MDPERRKNRMLVVAFVVVFFAGFILGPKVQAFVRLQRYEHSFWRTRDGEFADVIGRDPWLTEADKARFIQLDARLTAEGMYGRDYMDEYELWRQRLLQAGNREKVLHQRKEADPGR